MVVNCVAYRDGVRLGEIPVEDISEFVKEPRTFVWVGLHDPDDATVKQVQEEFGLHELAVEDARKAHQRPKLENYGDSIFLAMKTAHIERDVIAYGETHFFVGAHYLVTVRHGGSEGYAKVREHCEHSPRNLARGPGFALYGVMDFIVDNYEPAMERLEDEFEVLEESVFKGPFDKLSIERLYELKRELLTLRNAAAPVVEMCTELMRFHEELIPKEIRVYFRDVQDHATRVVAATDHMREMLMTAMQVNLSLVTVAQNEVVKKFSGWGAILVLPTVIFSLYGMNFKHMPELEWYLGYPAVLGATAVACGLLYRNLKKIGWI
jgi:magnesium transporter